jgi:P4 family phage/plasmid primase-like protien
MHPAGTGGVEMTGLQEFLDRFKIDGGKSPTHTRFGDEFGSYYIPNAETDRFFRVYSRHVERTFNFANVRHACIVERHRDVGPLVIDLDFRHELSDQDKENERGGGAAPARRYSRADVDNFIRRFVFCAREWIPFPDGTEIFMLEKPSPRIDKGVVKDGIHFIVPGVVVDTRVQLLMRRALVDSIKANNVFQFRCTNSVDDIVDESVIRRNGWMMYGSGKANDDRYDLTHAIAVKDHPAGGFAVDFERRSSPRTAEEVLRLVSLFSVRNKEATAEIHPHRLAELDAVKSAEETAMAIVRNPRIPGMMTLGAQTGKAVATPDEFVTAKRLARMLSASRADDYLSWMKVGWCLHNVDDRLMPEWIEFSRMSPKFQPGLCENVWDHMCAKEDGLGMGSLRKWARDDSPGAYDVLVKESVSGHVRAAMTGLHHDVAMVVKALYGARYVCTSVRQNSWYVYGAHRWEPCDSGYSLRRMLSVDVYNRFTCEAGKIKDSGQTISAERDEDGSAAAKHASLMDSYKRLNDVAGKLKTGNFKDAVMRECRELMYQPEFESQLDAKPHLLGFDNGVYDLEEGAFRDGCPEDMVSFSTKYGYVPFRDDDDTVCEIRDFFSKIQPRECVREYLLRLLGSYLNGNIREERFHVWTGCGANGKSLTVDLFERALGDYCCKLPVSLLTQKRAASNAATSEIARLKGRRFACLQEPGNDETLNVGLMKELTGGDRIMARQLYHEPIEFRSYARLALICNNLPTIPSTDGGSWRRIRLIEFLSTFKQCPDPSNPYEFPLNTRLSDRLDAWAPYMMALLIHYYGVYMRAGNPEPEPVMRATRQYQQSQDAVEMFINHSLQTGQGAEGAETPVNEMHARYKLFLQDMSIRAPVNRDHFVKELERHTKLKAVGMGASQRFRGIAFKDAEEADEGSDAENEVSTS